MLLGVFQKHVKVFFWKTFWLFWKTGIAAEQDFWRLRLEMELRGRGEQGGAGYREKKMQISEYFSVHKRKSFQKRPKSFLFENFSALSENRNEKIALQ
ncbi:MAG: hypothetical protein PUE84_08580 [Firmicutes bacterium]|nr:hypothetical protein [Bacillota bacterium]